MKNIEMRERKGKKSSWEDRRSENERGSDVEMRRNGIVFGGCWKRQGVRNVKEGRMIWNIC